MILQPGPSTCVTDAADARPNDIHKLPVGVRDVKSSSNCFALKWWVFSSDLEKFKWLCFDLALKLALSLSLPKCCNWRASEASETLLWVYKFELVRYMCIFIYLLVQCSYSTEMASKLA